MLSSFIFDFFFDYTFRTVALGSLVLGFVSGTLGAFAVLRQQSLLGDAVSHAALPGLVLAFLISGSREPAVLLAGAIAAGGLGMLYVTMITRHTFLKQDTALGIVLAVFFGFGMVLLTYVQRLPTAGKAGLDAFLFGQAATMLVQDVVVMASLGAGALGILVMLWKEMKLITFDPHFASTMGFPTRTLDVLLIILTVVAVVVGLQMVGVVLMSAMLVAPGAAARQWTDRFNKMVLVSGLIGAGVGVTGSVISSRVARLPTGPTIVVILSGVVMFSLLFAPGRGIHFRTRIRKKQRWQFAAETLAVHLLNHEGSPEEATENSLTALERHLGWDLIFAQRVARWAVVNNLVSQTDGSLRLTSLGRETAKKVMVR